MRKHQTLVFVEIKQRKTVNMAAYAISERQKQRILRGALSYVQKNPRCKEYDLRFDAVLIALPFGIKHIANAWQA